jgi:hypothetical protein
LTDKITKLSIDVLKNAKLRGVVGHETKGRFKYVAKISEATHVWFKLVFSHGLSLHRLGCDEVRRMVVHLARR